MYRVFLSYPMSAFMDNSVDEAKLAEDARIFGGAEFGSGAGFGQRDIDYGSFPNWEQASDFAAHARGVHEDADSYVEKEDENV